MGGDEQQMTIRQVRVFISLDTHRAIDIPAYLRVAIEDRAKVEIEVTAVIPD